MKKRTRFFRLFSAFLALCMVLSLFPVSVLGAEEEAQVATVEDIPLAEKKAATDYHAMLENLPALIPVNEFFDIRSSGLEIYDNGTFDRLYDLNGLFYFVSEKTVDGKLTYFIMDPSTPTIYAKVAATPVTIENGRIYGADPEMAFEVIHDTTTSGTNRWEHRLKLCGDYDELADPYYLSPSYVPDTGAAPLLRQTGILDFGLVLRQGPGDSGKDSLGFYRNIKPSDFGGESTTGLPHYVQYGTDADGNQFFEMAPMPDTFGEGQLFKLYRILTDRVNVENLYEMLLSVKPELSYDPLYSAETHAAFLSAFEEAVELYTTYNGKDLTEEELPNIDTLQEQVDAMALKLMGYRSQLRISMKVLRVSRSDM